MSTPNLLLVNQHKRSPFGYRLKEAFQGLPNKEIARKLGVSNSAITTYMLGRIPPAEMLIEISRQTNYSIHWLITGEGERLIHLDKSRSKKSAHTILIANDKGGAGRTTSAITLAVEFARRGHRTLFIDDLSGNGTMMLFPNIFPLGVTVEKSLFFRMESPLPEQKMYFRTPVECLDLCSFEEGFWPHLIKNKVENARVRSNNVKEEYRFIVIDTLSHRNPFTHINLFTASILISAQVLIPIPVIPRAMDAIKFTLEHLHEAKKSSDEINLLAGFFTLMKPKRQFYQKIRSETTALFPGKLMKTLIHDREELRESESVGSVQLTAPNSVGAAQYAALADEIMKMLE